MAKNSVSDWDTDPDLNLDIGGTSIAEGCAMANLNNALRQIMAQAKAGFATSAAVGGYLYGLTLSNNGADATNDVDIAAGVAIDGGNAEFMTLSAALTKRLDATWAVGTGNGGLDTGSKANSTWYHLWLIKRPDTGVVDALFSTSATAPTMPANYTLKRRIGAVRTNGSGAILAFAQVGDEFLLSVPVADVSTTIGTTATLSTLASVPTGVKVNALVWVFISIGAGAVDVLITSPDQADTTPTSALFTARVNSAAPENFEMSVRTNTSAQIRSRSDTASTSIGVIVKGWIDTRGRLA